MVPVAAPGTRSRESWTEYLARFHDERSGITEALLGRARDVAGLTPYEWLADAAPTGGRALALGCGTGPTAVAFERWVGLDPSPAELRLARARGRGPLVTGRGDAVPVESGALDTVVAAMSLMVVEDPPATIREIARVLRPRGALVVLVPARGPLSLADRLRHAALLVVLGRRSLPFPHPDLGRALPGLLAAAGLVVTDDEARRFAAPMPDRQAADLLVDSLYLPEVSPRRIRAARALARHWGRGSLGLPLRRVVAWRPSGAEPGPA